MNPVQPRVGSVPFKLFVKRVAAFSTYQWPTDPDVAFFRHGAVEPTKNPLLGPDERFPFPGGVASQLVHINKLKEQRVKMSEKIQRDQRDAMMDKYSISLKKAMKTPELVKPDEEHFEQVKVENWEKLTEKSKDVMRAVEISSNSCPKLLRKDFSRMFPDVSVKDFSAVTVINLTQKSTHDMSAWSHAMEEERENLMAAFIHSATAICTHLQENGFWADFIDPHSGRPYLGTYTGATLFETDDAYREMGFKIEDLGCCKVLKHVQWGTHAFVGTIFTMVPLDHQIVKEIMDLAKEE